MQSSDYYVKNWIYLNDLYFHFYIYFIPVTHEYKKKYWLASINDFMVNVDVGPKPINFSK